MQQLLQGSADLLRGVSGGGSGRQPTAAELDAYVSELARAAEAEQALRDSGARLSQPIGGGTLSGPTGSVPPWLEGSEDESRYRALLAQMEQELEAARREERQLRERQESGDDSLDQLVDNNAYDYTSLIGIVETDLSRWAEWLATQNVRELERLALQAGYPNLASALADAQNLIRYAGDEGYRRWALQAPSCGGLAGCGPSYLERWAMKQATVALGDILASSRDIFSTAGFTDIGISGLNLAYLLRDNALEDGDMVRVRISQFGRVLYEGQVDLTNLGERFSQLLQRGVASLEILALNEGFSSPNTAQIVIDDVVRGNGTQSYSLQTGETATLRIESNAGGN